MVQDVESGDVGQVEEEPRKRRGGILPLAVLLVVMLVILWLLGQFLFSLPIRNEITEVTKTSTIDVNVPAVPEPEIPVSSGLFDEETTQTVGVPNVVGDPQSSATITLENAGYGVSVTYVYSDSVPAGLVVSQYPGGGSALMIRGVVGIVVSRGNGDLPEVTMPQVIGLTRSAAVAKVTAAGFKPYILYGTDERYAGRVGNQWPLAGTRLPKGSDGFVQVMVAN